MSQYIVPESLAVSDSGFLFLSSTGETFTLNEIGKEIFKLLQSGDDAQSIEERVLSEYDIDRTTFERDFDDFINQLNSFKLIATA
jgi:hypothetical protein